MKKYNNHTVSSEEYYDNTLKIIFQMKKEILLATLLPHIPCHLDEKFEENQKILLKIEELENIINKAKKMCKN